jgi:hypothetical protein
LDEELAIKSSVDVGGSGLLLEAEWRRSDNSAEGEFGERSMYCKEQ